MARMAGKTKRVCPRSLPLVPVERGAPEVVPFRGAAAGAEGVVNALGYTLREAGVRRGASALLQVNQALGFDCPGCAWPDPEERSRFEFCENGARAVADETTRERVTPKFFRSWSLNQLRRESDRFLNRQGRLTHPMILCGDHYVPIAWEEAFSLIGRELRALESPDQAIFYTSGRTSNEAAFLYQLFARQFGTNNLPDCSNMCHESSGTALNQSLGVGKGSVQLEDFGKTDLIFVVGQNPATNHPRMLSALQQAKESGARIIAINPLREAGLLRFKHPQRVSDLLGEGTQLADLYLQVRIGGDVALVKGIIKAVLEEEAKRPGEILDGDFLKRYTWGYEQLEEDVRAQSWSALVDGSGVPEEAIRKAAQWYCEAGATIACWAMGVTQHKNGVANVQELTNLLLLRGNVGRPGAGVCPVRGHSNVQGDRTMGIWEKMPPWAPRMSEHFGIPLPSAEGVDTVGAIHAMRAGRAKVLIGLGGNFVAAAPDSEVTMAALECCRLTVQIATKLNRSHLIAGEQALILPCLSRSERDEQGAGLQWVSVENSMGVVHSSRGSLSPVSDDLMSEPAIVCNIAHATLGDGAIGWRGLADDYAQIRDHIEAVVPGFAGFNTRAQQPGGLLLPNPVRERVFHTASGRAEFHAHALPSLELEVGQLLMTTIRSHDQFNTTIYEHNDRYRGIYGYRRILLMNGLDLEARGLKQGDRVDITSYFRGEERHAPDFAVVAFELPSGAAASYFPEANVLVPLDSYADRSRTPTSKAVVIRVFARNRHDPG